MKKIIILLFTLFLFSFIEINIVLAEEESLIGQEIGFLPELQMQGRLEANGTYFELTNSSYLNITLDSSESIKLVLESVPEMITMYIEAVSDATSTVITLSGFTADTTYHKYEDDYHNYVAFTTDSNGKYTYTQDLSKSHLIFIQPRASTKFIKDDATGGDCTLIGTWSSATKTCTLTMNLTEGIQIDSNGVTLDGNGHTLTGSNTGYGVYLSGRTGVTIKNLNVKNFTYGIYLHTSSSNTLTSNNANSNTWSGIFLHSSSSNTLTNNNANSNSYYGIYLYPSNSNTLTSNTANSNYMGISLYYSNSNTLTSNNANSNTWSGIYISLSGGNTLTSNNANSNSYYGIWLYPSSNGNTLTNNNANSNSVGIILYTSNNNTLTNNNANSNSYYGIWLYYSNSSTLTGNTVSSNSYYGILFGGSSNTLTNNNVNSNSVGIILYTSSNNKIYNNNFINNPTQAYVSGGGGNIFNLSVPIGGNYWSNYDTPIEGCHNLNNDNFCDAPYVFTGGQDNLPWTTMSGWEVPADSTPPIISINTPMPYSLYIVGMALDFSASDLLSGLKSVSGILTDIAGESQEVNSGFVPSPGVYTLVVSAIDNAGNIAMSEPIFFVVYDPTGGFATGGGWFYPDSESTLPGGKAAFGFIAKYKNANSTGSLEFQYKDADINLKSMSIDWLVISGVSAQFQGSGTINGEGLYTFRVLAKDNGEPGVGIDHFDIKIWQGTDTDADPIHKAKNILSGGNVVVHKK